MAAKGILGKIAGQYDKIVLAVVVIGLVGSLSYLAVHVGMLKTMQEEFEREINAWRPAHPEAVHADVSPYEAAERDIAEPYQIAAWSNALFVPETRVWCVDCRLPIPKDVDVCIFCQAKNPNPRADKERDWDKDGLKDEWENQHGMNPLDPTDADKDQDDDGFTAREEYMAEPQTDPTDKTSRPPIVAKLRVKDLKAKPFELRFRTYMKGANDEYKFQLNSRGGQQSFFVKMGQSVAGFVVSKFEIKKVKKVLPGSSLERTVDESELTLVRGEDTIVLVLDKFVTHRDYKVHLLFLIDGSEYELRIRDEFDLQGEKYRLIGIDSDRSGVVIERLHDKKKFNIWKDRESTDEMKGTVRTRDFGALALPAHQGDLPS